MAGIRGSSLVSIKTWIAEQLGEGYEKFIESLRKPVRETLTEAQPWEWYSPRYLNEIYRAVSEKLSNENGSLRVLDNLGQFLGEDDLANARNRADTCLPVSRVMQLLPVLWSRYRDCGELEVSTVDEGNGIAEVTLVQCAGGEMHTEVVSAWIETVAGSMCECKVSAQGKLYPYPDGGTYYWKVSWQ